MKIQEIPLSQVRTGVNELREATSGDLDHLQASLSELGQRVPIYVKPNGSGYEVIYGHRRVVAAKKARMKTILAEIAPATITKTEMLLAAIAENLAREDMTAMEKGRALSRLHDATGWPVAEMSRKTGVSERFLANLLKLVSEPKPIQELMSGPVGERITEYHVRASRSAGDDKTRVALLKQAAKTEMTAREVEERAKVLANVKSDAVKEKVIKADANSTWVREAYAKAIERAVKPREAKSHGILGREAKGVLDSVRECQSRVGEWRRSVKRGVFSPEAIQFLRRRVDALVSDLRAFSDLLKETSSKEE